MFPTKDMRFSALPFELIAMHLARDLPERLKKYQGAW